MKINMSLFPLPYVLNGANIDGSMVSWPEVCGRCVVNTCKDSKSNELSSCSYGYNVMRLPNNIVIGGFVVREWPEKTQARKKRMKEVDKLVSRRQLDSIIKRVFEYSEEVDEEIKQEKSRIIDEYVQKEQYKSDFLQPLKQRIIEGLSFVHDYMQINTQIGQNINYIIETKYEGSSFEDKLDKTSKEEKGIYKASKILEGKLTIAKLLVDPDRINKKENLTRFLFRGLVHSYCKIYSPLCDIKGVIIELLGKSFNEIVANPEAVAVIAPTLIDNAVKYSPRSGKIRVFIQDTFDGVDFEISSYGPRIKVEEEQRIFEPFYRGEAAIKQEEEGAGYGLYVSQLVAKNHLGTEIKVEQEKAQKAKFGHYTKFSIKLPLKSKKILHS